MSNNQDKRKFDDDNDSRLHTGQRLTNSYSALEDSLVKILRWFSTIIDTYIFNSKHLKLTALVLALLLFFSVNYDSSSSLFGSPILSSRDLGDVQVNVIYNEDAFEVSGLPETVNVIITGDSSSVISASSSAGYISANLEGLTEGTHTIKFTAEGFSDNVNITISPSEATVTLTPKSTQEFTLSYDFINTSHMNSIYSLGTPTFESTTVNVRASKTTLDSIAFVKALIDVSGVESEFEQDATIVAYDSSGNPVDCEIIPSTMHVTVPVSSPNKTVAINVQVTGTLADGSSIESISLSNDTVTIYASESVLSSIDSVVVTLDASTLTGDTTVLRPITLPSGVNSSSINQVTMTVTLGETVSKVIEGVPISFVNNTEGYRISADGYQSSVAVTVTGTQTNIDAITADDISAYIDFTGVQPGANELAINLETSGNPYVTYTLEQSTINVNVLTSEDTTSETGVDDSND